MHRSKAPPGAMSLWSTWSTEAMSCLAWHMNCESCYIAVSQGGGGKGRPWMWATCVLNLYKKMIWNLDWNRHLVYVQSTAKSQLALASEHRLVPVLLVQHMSLVAPVSWVQHMSLVAPVSWVQHRSQAALVPWVQHRSQAALVWCTEAVPWVQHRSQVPA